MSKCMHRGSRREDDRDSSDEEDKLPKFHYTEHGDIGTNDGEEDSSKARSGACKRNDSDDEDYGKDINQSLTPPKKRKVDQSDSGEQKSRDPSPGLSKPCADMRIEEEFVQGACGGISPPPWDKNYNERRRLNFSNLLQVPLESRPPSSNSSSSNMPERFSSSNRPCIEDDPPSTRQDSLDDVESLDRDSSEPSQDSEHIESIPLGAYRPESVTTNQAGQTFTQFVDSHQPPVRLLTNFCRVTRTFVFRVIETPETRYGAGFSPQSPDSEELSSSSSSVSSISTISSFGQAPYEPFSRPHILYCQICGDVVDIDTLPDHVCFMRDDSRREIDRIDENAEAGRPSVEDIVGMEAAGGGLGNLGSIPPPPAPIRTRIYDQPMVETEESSSSSSHTGALLSERSVRSRPPSSQPDRRRGDFRRHGSVESQYTSDSHSPTPPRYQIFDRDRYDACDSPIDEAAANYEIRCIKVDECSSASSSSQDEASGTGSLRPHRPLPVLKPTAVVPRVEFVRVFADWKSKNGYRISKESKHSMHKKFRAEFGINETARPGYRPSSDPPVMRFYVCNICRKRLYREELDTHSCFMADRR